MISRIATGRLPAEYGSAQRSLLAGAGDPRRTRHRNRREDRRFRAENRLLRRRSRMTVRRRIRVASNGRRYPPKSEPFLKHRSQRVGYRVQDAALFSLFQRGDQVQRVVQSRAAIALAMVSVPSCSATSSRIVSSSSVRMTGSNVDQLIPHLPVEHLDKSTSGMQRRHDRMATPSWSATIASRTT